MSNTNPLKYVQQYSFAVLEAQLYLDSHPNCADALAYYNKYKKLYEEAKTDYEATYGPLTADSSANDECWQWVKAPWPWELAANEEV